MFKRKTVFILGAGASWHYGYPTGEKLVRSVKEKAELILQAYVPLLEDGRSPSFYPDKYKDDDFGQFVRDVREVKSRLSQANPLVIDDFLGRNKDIADVGKLLIAMVLLDCEKSSEPRPKKKDLEGTEYQAGDWIRYIVQHLIIDCDEPEELLSNQVTFVTFNYDLSLERRVHEALKNYQWFADGGYSDKFFSAGRIYHVYGQLRDFDPMVTAERQIGFSGEHRGLAEKHRTLADAIDRAWNASLALDGSGKPRIRTIGPDEKSVAPDIVKAIADAEYLYFLGYGFDRRNNDLLGLGRYLNGVGKQHVMFTNFGNHNKVSNAVANRFHINQNALAGQHYSEQGVCNQGASSGGWVYYPCEKSTKSVYDALAEDFDWPE